MSNNYIACLYLGLYRQLRQPEVMYYTTTYDYIYILFFTQEYFKIKVKKKVAKCVYQRFKPGSYGLKVKNVTTRLSSRRLLHFLLVSYTPLSTSLVEGWFSCVYETMKLVSNPTQALTITFGSSGTYTANAESSLAWPTAFFRFGLAEQSVYPKKTEKIGRPRETKCNLLLTPNRAFPVQPTANAESSLPSATAKPACPRKCRALRPNLPNLLFAKYIAYSYMWYQLYSLTLQLRSYISWRCSLSIRDISSFWISNR